MNFKEPITLAYLAGRLEERGRLHVLKNGTVRVGLRTWDTNLLEDLHERFGGTCFKHGKPLRSWWRVQGENALDLLRVILPYLIRWQDPAQQLLRGKKPVKAA